MPMLAGDVEVPDDVAAAFRRDGHCVVRGLARPDELADVTPTLLRLGVEHAYDQRPIEERDTYGRAFLQSRGDATFHAGWTVHCAPANPTGEMRAVMTVIYVADGARVAGCLSPAQDFDRKVWLGGKAPGELVDGELNPRLWPV